MPVELPDTVTKETERLGTYYTIMPEPGFAEIEVCNTDGYALLIRQENRASVDVLEIGLDQAFDLFYVLKDLLDPEGVGGL